MFTTLQQTFLMRNHWEIIPRSQNPGLVKILCNNWFISIEWTQAHTAGRFPLFVHSVRKLSAQAIVCLEQSSGTPQPALCAPAYVPACVGPPPVPSSVSRCSSYCCHVCKPRKRHCKNSRDFFFLGDTCSWHIPLHSRNKLKWKIKSMKRHQSQRSNTDSQQNWVQHMVKAGAPVDGTKTSP